MKRFAQSLANALGIVGLCTVGCAAGAGVVAAGPLLFILYY